jgi:hypothetical protein
MCIMYSSPVRDTAKSLLHTLKIRVKDIVDELKPAGKQLGRSRVDFANRILRQILRLARYHRDRAPVSLTFSVQRL